MAKFGELVSGDVPVLLHFYLKDNAISEKMHEVVKEVANYFGDKARVVEINADANRDIVRALKVSSLPDFMIYKDGEMHWRIQGGQTSNALKNALENYTTP
ncbi:MAG TPA: thioredoxin family protein [Flavobacteriaceae bacterium]|nr:thioredoxin family protein [Flavobacteriaceae bacterium]